MRKYLSISAIFLIILLTACKAADAPVNSFSENNLKYISDYKEIPGITKDELRKIETLKLTHKSFTYGSLQSEEAFYRSDGAKSGFSVLFCEMLSRMFGVTFVPTFYDHSSLTSGIEDHSIDFTGEFASTDERLNKYLMTDAIYARTIKIFTNKNLADVSQIAKERPVRCALLEGSVIAEQLAEVTSFPIEILYVPDYETAAQQFINREIDAFFEETPAAFYLEKYDFIKIEDYFPVIYSPVTMSTANAHLEPIITVLQKYLKNGGIAYLASLYSKGNYDYLRNKLADNLTAEEKNYLSNLIEKEMPVDVVYEPNNYPISFYNDKAKEFQGISVDILNKISELIDVKFKEINSPKESSENILNRISENNAQMITSLVKTEENKDKFIWSEQPYSFDTPALITTEKHDTFTLNQILYAPIGLVTDSQHSEIYEKWFPDSDNSYYYKTLDEAFNALNAGQIEFFMASKNMFLSRSNYHEISGFKIGIAFDHQLPIQFAFNKNERILWSIINKAQPLVSTAAIKEHWEYMTVDYKNKFTEYVLSYRITAAAVSIIFISLLLFLYTRNKILKKKLRVEVPIKIKHLEQKNSILNTIFTSIPDFVFCKDINGEYTHCNESFMKYLNLSEGEIIGETDDAIYEFAANDDYKLSRLSDTEVIKREKSMIVEEYIYSPYFKLSRLFEITKTPLIQNNEVLGIMAIARDITERKKIEAASKVAFNTKNDFIVRINHEIKTPLNAISEMLHTAKESLDDKTKLVDSLNEITKTKNYLLGVLNDIMDISKIDPGKLNIVKEPFNLIPALLEVNNIMSQKADEKFIKYTTNINDINDICLLGDKKSLSQVLLNLLDNAVKYSRTYGCVNFGINIVTETPREVRISFVIADNGIGMTPEQTTRLFDSNEQRGSEYGVKRENLVISQNLVGLMGGFITVKSEPRAGSIFSFELSFPKAWIYKK